MTTLLKNGNVFLDGAFRKSDLILKGDKLFVFDSSQACSKDLDSVIELDNKFILPGFADVHVHFREPGFSYKETIKSGSMAAARGSYTHVCTMPNLNPAPSTLDALKVQLEIIQRDSCVHIHLTAQSPSTRTAGANSHEWRNSHLMYAPLPMTVRACRPVT